LINVILYTRAGCHLCDQVKLDLESLQNEHPHQLVEIDVDANPDLQKAYGFEVPVVEIGPYKLKAPFGRQELQLTLGAARDRQIQIDDLDRVDDLPGLPSRWTGADRFTSWFANHYVAILNLVVLLYLGLPVLAPLLMKAGIDSPARLIYRAYGLVCHQLAYRSFFLFGEQYAYPRQSAGVESLIPYGQATGMGEASSVEDLYAARNFVGNETIGFKIALCQRDVAIYFGIFLFGIIFALTGRRLNSLPWYLWLLIGMLPIGIDGLSQLLSQPPLDFLPLRESTPFWRALTGFLFGYTTAWFGYPLVEETMAETRQIMQRKQARIQRSQAGAVQPTVADKA